MLRTLILISCITTNLLGMGVALNTDQFITKEQLQKQQVQDDHKAGIADAQAMEEHFAKQKQPASPKGILKNGNKTETGSATIWALLNCFKN